MSKRFLAFRWIAALAVLAILAVNGVGLLNMRSELSSLSNTKRSGLLWSANQLEFELLRLTEALALFSSADPDVSADNVRLRFDILWSRHAVTEDGEDGVPGADSSEDFAVLGALGNVLRKQDNVVTNLVDGDIATANQMLAAFAPFSDRLRKYTLAVKEERAEIDKQARQEIWLLSQYTIAFGVAMGLGSLLVAALFFADSRHQRRISKENLELLRKSQAANQARLDFLSTVSHELRTPLTSVKSVLAFIRGGLLVDLDAKASRMIEIAYSNALKLEKLIDDILDSVKSENGDWSYEFNLVDLAEIVRSSVLSNSAYRIGRKIKFIDQSDTPLLVSADIARIEQVLSNIVSNALKFSDKDTMVLVTVFKNGERACVSVKDSGIGIPEDFYDKVFEKFTQADASDTKVANGTGLGMSIAKRIVLDHGGTIEFESSVGVGTVFTFGLPLKKQDEQANPLDIAA